MRTGTMTSKGQITVPKAVREAMGLTAGTRVDFRLVDGRWTISAEPLRAADLAGIVATDGRSVSLDAMDEAIAAAAAQTRAS